MEEPKELVKINRNIDKKYVKKICMSLGEAVVVFLYYFALNFANNSLDSHYFERGLQLCTMLFLFVAIFFYEKAYKKDSDSYALQGIEMMFVSAYTLTIPYITQKYNFEFKTYTLVLTYFFAIYFILKSIVIYTRGKKNLYDDYSDIKEIVKNEPVKKEATKKEKLQDDEEETLKRKELNIKSKNLAKSEKIEKEEKVPEKNAIKPKKTETKKTETKKTTTKKTTTTKKKAATKKTSTAKKSTTKKESEEKPKKESKKTKTKAEESKEEKTTKTRTKRTTKKATPKAKKD